MEAIDYLEVMSFARIEVMESGGRRTMASSGAFVIPSFAAASRAGVYSSWLETPVVAIF